MARIYSAFFAGYFLQLGIYLPFVPLWLDSQQFSATWIGWLVALPMLFRSAFVPAINYATDRWQIHRMMMIGLVALATILWGALRLIDDPYVFAVIFVSNAVVIAAILPMVDARAYREHRAGRMRYGRVRLAGSAAFVVAGLAISPLIQHYQGQTIHNAIAATHVMLLAMVIFLPLGARQRRDDQAISERPGSQALMQALNQPRLLWLMLAASLIQSSHAGLYSLGSVHWANIGYGETAIAAFWATGVIAEILFFAQMHRGETYLTVERLLLIGGVLGTIRWLSLGIAENVVVIAFLQTLHAASFAATHVAGVKLVSECLGERFASTGQAIYASLSMGVLMALLSAASGYAFIISSVFMYVIMAVCCFLGVMMVLVWSTKRNHSSLKSH